MGTQRVCFRCCLSLVLIGAQALAMQPGAFAQETTAGIQGTAKDAQGGTVPGATVEVTSPALIGKKEVKTDSTGVYRFTNLPPGEYTLTITAPNFRTYKRTGIDLSAGRLPTIDVQLEIGITSQVVEVSAAAPIVDVTESKAAVTVTQDILEVMPKGRSFQSIIPDYRSDGLNANDQCLWFTLCGLRTNPRIGTSSSRRVDSPLDQDNTKKDHYRAIDPGFEIGGPIFKDKLWLFTSYIPSFTRLTRTVHFTGSDANGTPFGTRSFPESQDVHNALTRLDWSATS